MKNYYKILELNKYASHEDIRKQYKKMAIKFHPDKNVNVDPQKFKDINEAYQILINDETRKLYDNDYNYEFIHENLQNPHVVFNEFINNMLCEKDNVQHILNVIHGDKDKFLNNLFYFEFDEIIDDIKNNLKYKITGKKKTNTKLLSLICIISKYISCKNKINYI
jgi:DnaJ-class molecular chaperone